MSQLIDIGANLAHKSFDTDRDQVIADAVAAGVTQIVVTGSCLESNHSAHKLTLNHPGQLFSTAGCHPHHAKDYSDELHQQIETLAALEQVVAIGECGLDYNRNYSPHQAQQDAFEQQLTLAASLKKPLFLHQRDAHEPFLEQFSNHRDQITDAVVHCFTGNQTELYAYLDLDLYIGVTGWICDERRGQHLQELVKNIPANRLLLETDAPYLLPRDLKPKPSHRRNEPKYLPHIAKIVAHCRDQSLGNFCQQTLQNTRAFFNLLAT
ncbi:MAG: hydrolase TatD [Gammaproteobacteria bacterium]|nr:hydrolase TatD [Gammaproteobacteria bacterium]